MSSERLTCADFESILHAYLDRELDPVRNVEVETHLRDCAVCRARYESLQQLHHRMQAPELYFNTPSEFSARIRRVIQGAAQARRQESRGWLSRIVDPRGLSIAAAAVAAVLVAIVFLPNWRSREGIAPTDELVAAHVRSLMANHLVDVPSSDQHTVKPWFNGRLDFSPPVVDLAPQGFPLVGGRLDYFGGHAVAALVYQRRNHYINLFVRPAAPERPALAHTTSLQGYNVIAWPGSRMGFAAVSDLNIPELTEFTRLFQREQPGL